MLTKYNRPLLATIMACRLSITAGWNVKWNGHQIVAGRVSRRMGENLTKGLSLLAGCKQYGYMG